MNLDILGSAFVPRVFDGGRCWVWARGLESRLSSNQPWLDSAQSVALERRGE